MTTANYVLRFNGIYVCTARTGLLGQRFAFDGLLRAEAHVGGDRRGTRSSTSIIAPKERDINVVADERTFESLRAVIDHKAVARDPAFAAGGRQLEDWPLALCTGGCDRVPQEGTLTGTSTRP